MQVKDLMTPEPIYCTPHSTLVDVARLMRDRDCGAIPVVTDRTIGRELVGIITDRDIVIRSVAEGAAPKTLTAGECMSMVVASVSPEKS
jgi:CBS domain-containing protein